MKTLINTLVTLVLISTITYGQISVSQIEGRLEVYNPNDFSSIYIGYHAGDGVDGASVNEESDTYQKAIATSQLKTASGSYNSYLGIYAGRTNQGFQNSFFGGRSGHDNMGSYNSFFGAFSGNNNRFGEKNTFFGTQSGYDNSSGDMNSLFGYMAGASFDNDRSTIIGSEAGTSSSLDRAIAIGYNAKVDCSNCAVIGGTGEDAVNLGIGTETPEATLHVDGFSKFGSDAPKIKIKKLTGITSASEGGSTNIPHGLNSSKIISVNGIIQVPFGSTLGILPGYTNSGGFEYNILLNTSNIDIHLIDQNSVAITDKTIIITIIYEE